MASIKITQFVGLLFIVFCLGCASHKKGQPITLLSGVTSEGAPVCLDDSTGIPSAVEKFYAKRDLTTEEGKIDYLLERLRDSHLVFIRNRVEYEGPAAASFLRWKLERWENVHDVQTDTAQQFIDQIASGSKASGHPYAVVLNDGSRHDLKNVLQNELDALETCLKEFPPSSPQEDTTETPQNTTEVPSMAADIYKESLFPRFQQSMTDSTAKVEI